MKQEIRNAIIEKFGKIDNHVNTRQNVRYWIGVNFPSLSQEETEDYASDYRKMILSLKKEYHELINAKNAVDQASMESTGFTFTQNLIRALSRAHLSYQLP